MILLTLLQQCTGRGESCHQEFAEVPSVFGPYVLHGKSPFGRDHAGVTDVLRPSKRTKPAGCCGKKTVITCKALALFTGDVAECHHVQDNLVPVGRPIQYCQDDLGGNGWGVTNQGP